MAPEAPRAPAGGAWGPAHPQGAPAPPSVPALTRRLQGRPLSLFPAPGAASDCSTGLVPGAPRVLGSSAPVTLPPLACRALENQRGRWARCLLPHAGLRAGILGSGVQGREPGGAAKAQRYLAILPGTARGRANSAPTPPPGPAALGRGLQTLHRRPELSRARPTGRRASPASFTEEPTTFFLLLGLRDRADPGPGSNQG